jgi:hypothetical protein
MGAAIAEAKTSIQAIEAALIQGDLSGLKPEERVKHYMNVCTSLGLNPHTKPFGYLQLNGKTVLYALREATEQLRKIRGVSITSLEGKVVDDLYIVTATAKDREGRTDSATGAVNLKGLVGENKANAIMKAETKAKRRVTLSICGLGMLDEHEAEDVPKARVIDAEVAHVSINLDAPKAEPELDAAAMAEAALLHHEAALNATKDLGELQKAWFAIPAEYQPALLKVKDAKKKELEPNAA